MLVADGRIITLSRSFDTLIAEADAAPIEGWEFSWLEGRAKRDPELARQAAERVGLVVNDLRSERLRTAFYDVGAVVYFLRLVIWIVPGFTVEEFRERLRALHDLIERDGKFVAYASRFLIEATKPA